MLEENTAVTKQNDERLNMSRDSDSRDEETAEKYVHVHMYMYTNNNNNNNNKQRKVYTNSEREITFQKLDQILEREGKNFSKWVFEQALPYVRLHEPGNPQQRLDVLSKLGKPYKAKSCLECGAKPFVIAVKDDKRFYLCKEHFERLKIRLDGWKEV